MSQLHGKQLRNASTSLNKLDGTGVVAFTTGATMSFDASASLTRATLTTWEATDIVNKAYVDSVVQGLDVKESVKIKTESSITLTGIQTLQSVVLADGDRVLVNGQDGVTPDPDNGIWVVRTGAWERPSDFTGNNTVTPGAFVFVEQGTFADSGFVLVTDISTIDVDVTPIKFQQFSGAGQITAGEGLLKTGNTLDVRTGTGLTISSDLVVIANTNVVATSYGSATAIPTFTVNAQGQLTQASNVDISIPSGQVNNFTASVNNLVFDDVKFVDSNSIDFTVTDGVSVTADVKIDGVTASGLTVSSAGLSVNVDGVTININSSGQLVADLASKTYTGGDGISVAVDNVISVDLATNSGLTLAGGELAVNPTIAGNGLTYSAGVLDVNVGDGLAISGDNVVVDLAANSGLTLAGGDLAVASTIAGTGLTFSGGVLSVLAGSAEPKYLVSSGDILQSPGINVQSITFNDFSRIQAFVNGLEVSIGSDQSVAGLPSFTNQAIHLTGTGFFLWSQFNAGYSLEANDVVRIVYES
jgi:hypothetical protein